ncbi:MAG: PEGA domain-containing protein [Spirochaetota bacterium]
MRRTPLLLALIFLASASGAETLRGPLVAPLVVTPLVGSETSGVGLESIVLVELDGDPRFLDAVDLELTAPAAVTESAGAISLLLLGPISTGERSGVIDVVGEQLLQRPLLRPGKSFYQIVLHADASPDASAVATRIDRVVPPASFPIALSVVPRMKGLSDSLSSAEFSVAARPVTRNLGAVSVRYVREDGDEYDPDGALAPDFELTLDDEVVTVRDEYLLEPGLHRFRLRAERYRDQEITVGVERGRTVALELPLELALATVNYSAPRGASVYVNGQAMETATGDFTVPPGEHTIVVLVGDYTVTRRFTVAEQQTYSISVILDIVVEEIK